MAFTIDVKMPETGDSCKDKLKVKFDVTDMISGSIVEVRIQIRDNQGNSQQISIPNISVE